LQAHTHDSQKLRAPGVIGVATIHGYLNFHAKVMTDVSESDLSPIPRPSYITGLNDRPATQG
jgi:hypothetical protein